jgi:hypothetical protein
MNIQIERKDDSCFSDNCPAIGRVDGLPGWKLYIGKRPETLLDADGLAQLRGHVGPDEFAVLLPEDL